MGGSAIRTGTVRAVIRSCALGVLLAAVGAGCASHDPPETIPATPEPEPEPMPKPDPKPDPEPIPDPLPNPDPDPEPTPPIVDLRINEVVSNNEGVWVDEVGETDDYIELYNASSATLNLGDYLLFDRSGGHALPALTLRPKQIELLWADASPEQGEHHLDFKIKSAGERLRIVKRDLTGDIVVDDVEVPALSEHHAFLRVPDGIGAFIDCGWATPARVNGERCGPPPIAVTPNENPFAPYDWPAEFPPAKTSLTITEALLSPAGFVEVKNASAAALSLANHSLRFSAKDASMPWPGAREGTPLALPSVVLAPGEYLRVDVPESALTEIALQPNFEGVVSAVDESAHTVLDRLEFNDWPRGAALARDEQGNRQFRFCGVATPGAPNDACTPLSARALTSGYVHDLLTPGDFDALGTAHAALGQESVEAIVNLELGNTVSFINSNVYEFHYDFVRTELEKLPELHRCDPRDSQLWTQGWSAFVHTEYESIEKRHLVPLTLVRHGGANLSTVEFAGATQISPEQLEAAFFALMQHVPDPKNWAVRPQIAEQIEMFRAAEGRVPLVGLDAPFQGVTFQPLVAGTAYGTLRLASVDELPTLELGPRDIVLTDGIPNDIPLIAGLITETFQTPLSHVNVLSRSRNTPNMALRDARNDPRIAPFLGKVVRLDVEGFDFKLGLADSAEALAFWEAHKPSGQTLTPRLDLSRRGVVPLETCSLADIPLVGGKAAQFAELMQVDFCDGDVHVPDRAFAIPVVHSLEHLENSGAAAKLAALRNQPDFLADPAARSAGLKAVRDLILGCPIDAALHDEIATAVALRWPAQRVRFRSSSNVEDLAGFNGAGLYLSEGIESDGAVTDLDDAVRTVWASLWNDRAFSEREYYGVDQSQLGMAVLVHPGFPSERANGVGISRSVLDPTLENSMYINAQVGEALVTNPAPGIVADEFEYSGITDVRTFHNHSTFSPNTPVMSDDETRFLVCNLGAIQRHFKPLLDPDDQNPWFAMDVEFKLMGPARSLVIKQARSYSFGAEAPAGWCAF